MTINSSDMHGRKISKWRRAFVFWRRTSAVWLQITRQIVRQLINEPEWRLIVTVLPAVKAVPGDTICRFRLYRFQLDQQAIWLSDSVHSQLPWHFHIPFIIKKQPAVGTPMQAGLHPVE
jgi:hypothetical protein